MWYINMSWLTTPEGVLTNMEDLKMVDRHAFRYGGEMLMKDRKTRAKGPKGPLDEEMIEDADSRPEQFREEADRWHGDDKQ